MTNMIENPILRGFNPDPDIIRDGEDYYIVTSTFEWFPGYQIHHSKDLRHWKLITRPLDRISQLDMRGVPDSCGVWAPCITFNPHDQLYYLPYTNVRRFDGPGMDTPNYVVTAEKVTGPWSEPVYLNSSGFDASFFHDDDGKSWLVNMIVDHRFENFFGGIALQEYDAAQKKLVGKPKKIFGNTEHGCTEGPHMYKRNGLYYLLLAEGGTGYNHCMTLARSRNIEGPYEVHPQNPIFSSKDHPQNYLQRTGHGGLIETHDGQWYLTFLTGRPLSERGKCITGRETGIEKVEWRDDDWLYPVSGEHVARRYVEAPGWPEQPFEQDPERIEFDSSEIDINFQSLRVPMTPDWMSLEERKGHLRLYGRDSLSSTFDQSLIARRVQAHHIEASTCVEFEPVTYQQLAGLVCYYNTYTYHYLHVFGNDDGTKKFLGIISCETYNTSEPLESPIDVTGVEKLYLKVDYNGKELQFYYASEENNWEKIGPVLDGSILSDEHVEDYPGPFRPCFTGAFVGMACQDLSGRRNHADFDYFEYKEL